MNFHLAGIVALTTLTVATQVASGRVVSVAPGTPLDTSLDLLAQFNDHLVVGGAYEAGASFPFPIQRCFTGAVDVLVESNPNPTTLLGSPPEFTLSEGGRLLEIRFSQESRHQIVTRLASRVLNRKLPSSYLARHCQGDNVISRATYAGRVFITFIVEVDPIQAEASILSLSSHSRFRGMTLLDTDAILSAIESVRSPRGNWSVVPSTHGTPLDAALGLYIESLLTRGERGDTGRLKEYMSGQFDRDYSDVVIRRLASRISASGFPSERPMAITRFGL